MLFREETRAVQAGLIDALAYRPQMKQKLARMAHADKYEDLTLASVTEIAGLPRKAPSAQDIIAVVYADGEIDTSPNDGINSRKLVAELDKIGQDAAIKGVVLRVNSPGGSAFGSEQLWEAVDRLKQLKPVAVSMGDYAASADTTSPAEHTAYSPTQPPSPALSAYSVWYPTHPPCSPARSR